MIHYPKLGELRLVDCSLSDIHIHSLFYSPSNFSNALTILDLSSNILTSSTFQLLSNFSLNLQELYLSHNNIVLSSSVHSTFSSLAILDLSYNKMTSSVFQDSFNFSSKLQNLYLRNCSLRDDSFLMSAISITNSPSSLIYLDLSFNMFKSSSIFYWLFNSSTNLRTLNIVDNVLEGPIPDGFGKVMNYLEVLYLDGNKLQGEIPSFFGNVCTLQTLYLSHNKLSGEISNFFQNSSWCNRHVFQSLSLHYNNITGRLPMSIGLLSELENLSLDGNFLEGDVTESHLSNFSKLRNNLRGEIPCGIGSLRSLDSLDLSRNHFIGKIPSSLAAIDGLGKLDLLHNSLSGRIPCGRYFEIFDGSSFEGNIDLCSEQLRKSCPGDIDQTIVNLSKAEAINDDKDSCFYEALYMSMGIGYFTGFWSLVGPMLLWRSWRNAYLRFLNKLTDSIYDQLM
ncbi:receptor kinase-like protein Xa21 [Vigna radiata var. radiata]|uniref:Receptor kinase-like protein Xa21 n=1 Tax=Vigna radiata var. radiata TaxID=3916 RepID=A0A1S3TYL2_VIGRR|nr:receptor kinase-like protein Xa21 [Vigna radiata var. radiata]